MRQTLAINLQAFNKAISNGRLAYGASHRQGQFLADVEGSNMSVEFLEVEQIEVDLLPVEQITTITFKVLWWALKTRRTVWVL